MDAHGATLIIDIATVTGVAAITAMIARFLKQPAILGYLLAGLIVGPYIPIPLFADPQRITALAEVGVVLVMFAVGLEFRLKRLVEILPISGLAAVVQIGALTLAGHTVGQLMGWSTAASISLGATVAISSTMVVSAVLRTQPVDDDIRSHVFGILVVQDVVAIVLMALVTTLAAGQALELASIGRLIGELSVVVLGMLVLGLLVLPRLIRMVMHRFDNEVLVVLVVGAAFGLASVAELFGYSVALGAFIAGMAVAESGRSEKVEHAIESLRALFSAIFFVSIGMTVDPRMAWQTMPLAFGLAAIVIIVQFISVTSASILTGSSLRRSAFSGLALGQIGELSFILATIAIGGNVLPKETLPALVTVATITAFTTPFLLGRAQGIVDTMDKLIPNRLQHVLMIYQAFMRRGRQSKREQPLRRAVFAALLDWTALLLLFISYRWLNRVLDAGYHMVLNVGVAILAVPFFIGLVLSSTRFLKLARQMPRGDIGLARSIEAIAMLAIVLSVGVPTAAVIQPVVHGTWTTALLILGLAVVLIVIGLRFRNVDAAYTSSVAKLTRRFSAQIKPKSADDSSPSMDPLTGLDYHMLEVSEGSQANGATLAELNLRCTTGATVVSVWRDGHATPLPDGQQRLQVGDLLAISGSDAALDRARALFDSCDISSES